MIDFLWKNFFQNKNQSIHTILSDQSLFSELSKKELYLIDRIMHHRSYFPGEVVFKPSSNIGLYVIIKGKVHISYEDANQEDPVVLSRLQEGDFFGELSLVQDKAYHNTSATAMESTELYGIFKPEFTQFVEKYPKIGSKILIKLSQIIGVRLQKAGEKLATLSS